MLVIYHRADMDGVACAAILDHARGQEGSVVFYGADYSDPLPEKLLEQESAVWLVDFSFPVEEMRRLNTTHKLTWVDHHEPIMKECEAAGLTIAGLRRVGIAACCLLWEYLNLKPLLPEELPPALFALGEYDEGRFETTPSIMPIQYGARVLLEDFHDPLWEKVLLTDPPVAAEVLRDTGESILRYEKQQAKRQCRDYAYELVFEGHTVLVCNRPGISTLFFESRFDPARHAFMLGYARLPDKRWVVSMRAPKDSAIHLGELAKKYGGGGHRGAAGFTCEVLPFEI